MCVRGIWIAILACAALGAACGGGSEQDPCEGWTCSGHGECRVEGGEPVCVCEQGYRATSDGQGCILDVVDPCAGISCSGHGRCRVDEQDRAYCECEGGYFPSSDGLDCIENSCTGDCGVMGCCGDHCCQLVPSNSELGELPASGPSKNASGSFDTVEDCQAGSMLGDCSLHERTGAPDVCVCLVGDLQVASLRVMGEALLAVLAATSITVNGSLDISAQGHESGPGTDLQTEAKDSYYGGRGGTCGTRGGSSGVEVRCTPEIVPFVGGQSGQPGCGDREGGGGAGGLQLSAGSRISVSGSILANGGGGQGGQSDSEGTCLGGGGGGSGGAVLLEAGEVDLGGAIWANGGGGGGGGNNNGASGGDGQNASASSSPAAGGAGRDGAGCAFFGNIEGGDGGQGAVGDVAGEDGQAYDSNQCPPEPPFVGGGGGGGGSGRVRINTRTGCNCTGSITPPPQEGQIRVR
ncbi:MAG: hypothetical protein JXR96_06210 [Deltaproteobacteria bacterium]|nr:hypothetical protein [Deltaproteobacteria bacterium]